MHIPQGKCEPDAKFLFAFWICQKASKPIFHFLD